MRKLLAVIAVLVLPAAAAAAPTTLSASSATRLAPPPPKVKAPTRAIRSRAVLAPRSPFLLRKIVHHQQATWRWQQLMGKPLTKSSRSAHTSRTKAYRKWVLRLWKSRHHAARRKALNPPHAYAWRCIHRYEGSWTDGGAPYYGGLQMDINFQQTYGSYLLATKGTADNWTPAEQMWVAARAHMSGRGFYPWPNTARACGLI